MNRSAVFSTGLLLLALTAVPASAQEPDPGPPSVLIPGMAMNSLAAEFVLGAPLGPGPGFALWPGGRIEYDFLPGPWGLELGYAYRAKEYFSFDHGSKGWSGPWPWEYTSAGGLSEADWPFYQTRHVLSPGVLFRPKKSWLQPRLGLGLLVQFYVPGEAQDFYPGFQDSFRAYLRGVQALFGNSLKLGFDLNPWPVVSFGADFVFEVPDWGRFYTEIQERPVIYAKTNAHWELRLGVRL